MVTIHKIGNNKYWIGCAEIGTCVHWWSELNSKASKQNNLAVSKKLNLELPYDLAILFLGIYLKELKVEQTDTHTLMLIVALSTIAKGSNSNVL